MKRFENTACRATASNSAFTLVEMLLVIGLLTLISAATAPALLNWMEQNQLNQSAETFVLSLNALRLMPRTKGFPMPSSCCLKGKNTERSEPIRQSSSSRPSGIRWGDCVFHLIENAKPALPRGATAKSCRLWFYADGRCTSRSLEIRSGQRRRIVDLEGSTGQALIRQESR